jgi:type IV pilus assembly protein PilW
MKREQIYLQRTPTPASLQQNGFTLIELLISMALGMVVIGAMLVLYTTGAAATRYATAQGQMNEDAQMALSVLAQELRKAGNNPRRPSGVAPATAVNDLGQSGWGLRACANGFTDNTVLLVSGLTCNAGGTGGALAVVSEGDLVSGRNTAAVGATPARPMDCIGNGVVAQGVSLSGGNYYTMQSRLYIANNTLSCLGSGGAVALTLNQQPQVLAENIESMSFMFGIGSPADNKIVQGYYSATDINAPANAAFALLTADARWNKVVSARVCVVVRSENAILIGVDANPTYMDCNDNSVAIADGRLRRAYRTTVLLRNHGVGFDD